MKLTLTKAEALILGAILTIAEGVQLNIGMSGQAHAVLSMAIIVLVGAGLQAITPAAFLAELPPHLATLISSLLGAVVVLEESFALGAVGHTIVAVLIVAAASLGIGPAPIVVEPVPAPVKPAGVAVPNAYCIIHGTPGKDPLTIEGPFASSEDAKANADADAKAVPAVPVMVDVLVNPANC